MPHEITIKLQMKCIYENTNGSVPHFSSTRMAFLRPILGCCWWLLLIKYETRIIIHISVSTKTGPETAWIKNGDNKNATPNGIRWRKKATSDRQVFKRVCKLHLEIGFNLKTAHSGDLSVAGRVLYGINIFKLLPSFNFITTIRIPVWLSSHNSARF